MDVPAEQSALTGARSPAHVPVPVRRAERRRRPSGEAPPLPRKLQTSGVRWLAVPTTLIGAWEMEAMRI